jgi:two-component system chemotaxis response regulator CheY
MSEFTMLLLFLTLLAVFSILLMFVAAILYKGKKDQGEESPRSLLKSGANDTKTKNDKSKGKNTEKPIKELIHRDKNAVKYGIQDPDQDVKKEEPQTPKDGDQEGEFIFEFNDHEEEGSSYVDHKKHEELTEQVKKEPLVMQPKQADKIESVESIESANSVRVEEEIKPEIEEEKIPILEISSQEEPKEVEEVKHSESKEEIKPEVEVQASSVPIVKPFSVFEIDEDEEDEIRQSQTNQELERVKLNALNLQENPKQEDVQPEVVQPEPEPVPDFEKESSIKIEPVPEEQPVNEMVLTDSVLGEDIEEQPKEIKLEENNDFIKDTTVLIVDDARFMRNIMRNILEEAGYTVLGEAENGREAIKMAKKFCPTLITMDILMPDMDGITSMKEILKTQPETKVIMCTAVNEVEKIEESMKSGAKDFISKPFSKDVALNTIERVMRKNSR